MMARRPSEASAVISAVMASRFEGIPRLIFSAPQLQGQPPLR